MSAALWGSWTLPPPVLLQTGVAGFDSDGVSLAEPLHGREPPARDLYAETFAPLLDFGWSPLRSLRTSGFKDIAAPKPELFDLRSDPSESRNLVASDAPRAAGLNERVDRISPATLTAKASTDPDAAARLQSLGYVGGGATGVSATRPDPKDKRDSAARLAQVTSGELEGSALRQALEAILKEDPSNPQAHVRLGYLLIDAKQCGDAERHFKAAIAGHLPGADAFLGLAACQAAARRFGDAAATLTLAEVAEPDNPIVVANRGVLLSDSGRPAEAVPLLERALTLDPDFHEARFNLALAHLRAGQRAAAVTTAGPGARPRLPAYQGVRRPTARL